MFESVLRSFEIDYQERIFRDQREKHSKERHSKRQGARIKQMSNDSF